MQGIGWALKHHGNLSKLVIERENCKPPHILQNYYVEQTILLHVC